MRPLFIFLQSILFFQIVASVCAESVVRHVHSPNEIMVDMKDEMLTEGKKVIIFSKKADKIVAIGVVRDSEIENSPGMAKIRIEEMVDNLMIMAGDTVHLLDRKFYEDKEIPGFFSLGLNGDRKTPARFKELAYFGVFTSDGHTIDKGENLVSPFLLQHGVTDKFGIKVVNALWLDGYANIGAKYKVLTNKRAKITLNSFGAYKVQAQDWIGQFGGVITIPSNAKFQSHLMANVTFDPQYENAKATKDLGLFQDSDIRSITEYITDNWNRVLYGPVYNVELQTFGGTVSHMWIWDTFHMSLGLATKDLSNLTIGKEGYYYVYDLFWRF